MASVYRINSNSFDQVRAGCLNCGLLAWGESVPFTAHDAASFNDLIIHHRPIKRGACLYRAGSPLGSLHVIRSGFLITTTGNDDGLEQVTGFLMPGDPAGMDGIGSGRHQCKTIAIEDSSVCGISFFQLERLCGKFPELQRRFYQLLGNEIERDYGLMLLLGGMRAEERFAVFLLNFSARFAARGYSATRFKLPMRHQDIGSYLGLRLETISRLFTRFAKDDLISLEGKYLHIRNVEGLKQKTEGYENLRSLDRTDDIKSRITIHGR